MPLRNRVTPFGDIVALPGRGLLMGNRGVLHDDGGALVRAHQVRRWIACRTAFRGRRRRLLQPRRWTELFFLDEATALAAGHRPCAQCRFADHRRFKELWRTVFGDGANADAIDRVLHAERLDRGRKRTTTAPFGTLPGGTFVALGDRAWLVHGDALLAWTDCRLRRAAHAPAHGQRRRHHAGLDRHAACGRLCRRRASERRGAVAPDALQLVPSVKCTYSTAQSF